MHAATRGLSTCCECSLLRAQAISGHVQWEGEPRDGQDGVGPAGQGRDVGGERPFSRACQVYRLLAVVVVH